MHIRRPSAKGAITACLCLAALTLGGCVAATVASTAVTATKTAVKTTRTAVRTTGKVAGATAGAAVAGARAMTTPREADGHGGPQAAD